MNDDMYAWRKCLLIVFLGLIPLILIFFVFKTSPNNEIFKKLLEVTKEINVNTSSNNILLSKPLGIYTRLSFLFSVFFIIKYHKKINFKKGVVEFRTVMIRFVPFSIIYFIYTYGIAFSNMDIANGNRFLKIISSNDYLLLSYYIISFVGLYVFSVIFMLILIKLPSLYKRK